MTALKVFGIVLLVFLLLGFLPFGVVADFGEDTRVRLRVGALKRTVYPRVSQSGEAGGQQKPAKRKRPTRRKKSRLPKPTLSEWRDLVETAFSALGATLRCICRRVRVDPLDLTLTVGGEDPADAAVCYGMANALMFALMPRAEELFHIPAPSLHLRPDFDGADVSATGTVGVSLRLCDLFAIALALALPLAKWFLRFKKAHRHDTIERKIA